jgi:hypothetical protein
LKAGNGWWTIQDGTEKEADNVYAAKRLSFQYVLSGFEKKDLKRKRLLSRRI